MGFIFVVFMLASMVVNDLDLFGTALRPDKAYPPLLVDPNAVLARPVAPQGFQVVGWRQAQVFQAFGGIQHPTAEYLLGLLIAKAQDHD
jgi:hypothetical protein